MNSPAAAPYRIATVVLALALAFSLGLHVRLDSLLHTAVMPEVAPALVTAAQFVHATHPAEPLSTARGLESDFQLVAAAVGEAVVNITATREELSPRGNALLREGHGSGVLIDARGYVVTNYHVVDLEGARLSVDFADGRRVAAHLVATDAGHDLALLRLDARPGGYPAAQLGGSTQPGVGSWVLAFGSPLSGDLAGSVSAGIVSANYRSAHAVNLRGMDARATFIQTDAAVNPGNSGGPLVDLDGRVVGINTGILSADGGSQGIAFAVPAAAVRRFLQLHLRGWRGVA